MTATSKKIVSAYSDGSAIGNPGPGGYGVILRFGDAEKEISGGFRLTTNNRMELMGAIAALESLKRPSTVVLTTDSRYVVDGMNRGWARRWKANGWRRNRKEMALNPDLWDRLLKAAGRHDVTFRWIRGHAGHPENERCDQLANAASRSNPRRADTAFEKQKEPGDG